LAIFWLTEYLYYFHGICFFEPQITISQTYTVRALAWEVGRKPGFDLGFNFYNGDYSKTPEQAQVDKFDYAWEQIGLQKGMSLMDCGCGNGDWLVYCKNRGCDVKGINITGVQALECKSRGLDVEHTNWKDVEKSDRLRKKFYGKFDVCTFWDTIEHYTSSQDSHDLERTDAVYRSMFRMAHNFFKPESKLKRVWTSCLHLKINLGKLKAEGLWAMIKYFLKNPRQLQQMWTIYFMDRYASGSYPSDERQTLDLNARREDFELLYQKDCTYDYMYTSEKTPSHFGRSNTGWTSDKIFILVGMIVTSPYWWHAWFWFLNEKWMDQFDFDKKTGTDNSDVRLWWHMWEVKGTGTKKAIKTEMKSRK
jgi:hypothetical protein